MPPTFSSFPRKEHPPPGHANQTAIHIYILRLFVNPIRDNHFVIYYAATDEPRNGALTGSPRQTRLGRILSVPLRWLWKAISVAVPFVTFLFLIGLTAVELIPLGPGFGMLAFIVPVMAVVATILIKVIPAISAGSRRRAQARPARRRRELLALIPLLALLVIAAAIIAPTMFDRLSRNADAKSALDSFVLEQRQDVEAHGLERTLAELERARRSLSEEWTVPDDAPPISLEILQDIESYRRTRDEGWSTGFVMCNEDGVTIVVPAESASGMLREYQHSGTPMHEMTHSVICQIVGREAFFSIQLWFHEGMAQFYQNEPATKLFDRAFNRIIVWLKRDDLPSPERFCDYRLDGPGHEIELFYQTSWEFVRSLEAESGRATINAIVTDIAAGETFDHGMERRLGGVCADLYAKWTESL